MYALGKIEPVTVELIPARGDAPAVKATFNAQPSPLSLRAGRRAVAAVIRAGGPGASERAADAFSAALIRYNLLGWEGIGGADGVAVEPTHDRELLDDEGNVIDLEQGTISAFLAEPRLVEAADREYVLPWSLLDAEKNGYAPSPSGTSAGATPAPDIAGSPVTPDGPDDAATRKPAKPRARTKFTSRARKQARASGS